MAIEEYQGTPNRKGRRGYYTIRFTGKDVQKARGLLDKQAKESAAKIREEKLKEWTYPMRNHKGTVRHVNQRGVETILALQRQEKQLYPRGPVSSKPSFSMGAYIKDGRVVREGDPDY